MKKTEDKVVGWLSQTVAKAWPLSTNAEQRNTETEFWAKGKNSFIALPGKEGHSRPMPERLYSLWERLGGGFIVWGVENRALDEGQGRGKLALSFKTGVQWPQDWF